MQIRRNEQKKKIKDGKSTILVNWIEVAEGPNYDFELINLADGMYL